MAELSILKKTDCLPQIIKTNYHNGLKNTRGNNSHIGNIFQRSLYSSSILLLKFSSRE